MRIPRSIRAATFTACRDQFSISITKEPKNVYQRRCIGDVRTINVSVPGFQSPFDVWLAVEADWSLLEQRCVAAVGDENAHCGLSPESFNSLCGRTAKLLSQFFYCRSVLVQIKPCQCESLQMKVSS